METVVECKTELQALGSTLNGLINDNENKSQKLRELFHAQESPRIVSTPGKSLLIQ